MKEKEDIFIPILRYGKSLQVVSVENIYELAVQEGYLTQAQYDKFSSKRKYKLALEKGYLTQEQYDELSNKEEFVIALEKNYLTKISYDDINTETDEQLSIDIKQKKDLLKVVFFDNYDTASPYTHTLDLQDETKRRLATESYFKLVEFTELQEARLAAKESKKYANFALAISTITFVVSGLFSYMQLNNPVEVSKPIKIDQSQIIELNNAIKSEMSELKRKLDSIKLNVKEIKKSELVKSK